MKYAFLKRLGLTLKLTALFLTSLLIGGCAMLSYVGDDYSPSNLQTVKTNEDLVFNVYKKTIDNANIKIGITRTSVNEILALYVQIENLSYETPYSFKVEDLKIYNPDEQLHFITSNTYLNIWQTQEASTMSSSASFGNALTTMTGISSNYNDYNQAIVQRSSEENSQSTFKKIDELGSRILQHSIKVSSVISPRKSQYFYFFFEDFDKFPIKVTYKNLSYQFKL